jgi:hypothetical protein
MKSLRLLRQGAFTDEEIEAEFKEIQSTINITVRRGRFKEQFQGGNVCPSTSLSLPKPGHPYRFDRYC